MLVDLEALDVVVSQAEGDEGDGGEGADGGLGVGGAAYRAAGDHIYADHAGDEEGDDDVAVYAVE